MSEGLNITHSSVKNMNRLRHAKKIVFCVLLLHPGSSIQHPASSPIEQIERKDEIA